MPKSTGSSRSSLVNITQVKAGDLLVRVTPARAGQLDAHDPDIAVVVRASTKSATLEYLDLDDSMFTIIKVEVDPGSRAFYQWEWACDDSIYVTKKLNPDLTPENLRRMPRNGKYVVARDDACSRSPGVSLNPNMKLGIVRRSNLTADGTLKDGSSVSRFKFLVPHIEFHEQLSGFDWRKNDPVMDVMRATGGVVAQLLDRPSRPVSPITLDGVKIFNPLY